MNKFKDALAPFLCLAIPAAVAVIDALANY